MQELKDWFNSLPYFTRYWFGGTVAISLAARFGIIPPQWLILSYPHVVNNFEIWRLVTAVFFHPVGFPFLINCYFLVNYSRLLENGEYQTSPADYACLLLCNWLSCVLIGLCMNIYMLSGPMVLSVLYIWCNLNKDTIVTFWFGSQFKALYLPWVLFAMNFILGGGGMQELTGIIVGHLYFFLKYQYPAQYGGQPLINTPAFLTQWFPPRRGVAGFGNPPPGGPPPRPAGGGGWGQGHVLGQ